MNTATAAAAAQSIHSEVAAVLIARAEAEILREQVDAMAQALLDATVYLDEYNGTRITSPSDAWHMATGTHADYCASMDAAYIAAGHNVPTGYCPALMAESTQRDAEHALIEAARTVQGLGHMSTSRLLCGTKETRGLELHAEYLDLLIKLVVNA